MEQALGIDMYVDFDKIKSLTSNKNELIKKLINRFIEETPASVTKLKQYYSQHDWENVAATAHELQSGAAIIGIEEMRLTLKEIEQTASSTKAEKQIQASILKVEQVVNKAIEELRDFISAIA